MFILLLVNFFFLNRPTPKSLLSGVGVGGNFKMLYLRG